MAAVDDQIRSNAAALVATFGESVTYYAGGTGSGSSIEAVVDRQPAGPLDEEPRLIGREASVRVLNDAAEGVTSVQEGVDTIDVVLRVGQVAQRCLVKRVIQEDAGSFLLRVVA